MVHKNSSTMPAIIKKMIHDHITPNKTVNADNGPGMDGYKYFIGINVRMENTAMIIKENHFGG